MRSLGIFMIIMGIGSFMLNMLEREFILLMWVDNWGTGVGTAIRIALIVVGGVLLFVGGSSGDAGD